LIRLANSCSCDQFKNPHAQPYHLCLMVLLFGEHCQSSNHDVNNCSQHMNDARCANLEKTIYGTTKQIIEIMKENMLQYFNKETIIICVHLTLVWVLLQLRLVFMIVLNILFFLGLRL